MGSPDYNLTSAIELELHVPYPSPAVTKIATSDNTAINNGIHGQPQHHIEPTAGALPDNAADLSSAARGLLMRLLERDPRVRMRNLRQLQQSAFYMGFNIENVKARKLSPKSIFEKHFPNVAEDEAQANELRIADEKAFLSFDQSIVI
ncbi:unnamed protein product [Arctia plantaginis]|uniref:Uncharacterized protein n=1 Tax=Arctia plantaginis TaxID=874455 RepID=A0A8S0YMI4_ARCPL|nr:unnamed protein product [Arctia plantaginis]